MLPNPYPDMVTLKFSDYLFKKSENETEKIKKKLPRM